ncbi:MAG: hypothetical protein EBQ56_00115, partial [Proteobacteria bacterium]|nr:hypothetical protein [Pseudomonadota bacterium]
VPTAINQRTAQQFAQELLTRASGLPMALSDQQVSQEWLTRAIRLPMALSDQQYRTISGLARRENGSGPGGWTSPTGEGASGTLSDGRRVKTRIIVNSSGFAAYQLVEDPADMAVREAPLGSTPRAAVTPVVPAVPAVTTPGAPWVAPQALAPGELGGRWQSFRGDTAERDMHSDLITRLELSPHSTKAIVGRRDRTGPVHVQWFEGPDHRARAEAQAEVWARELLAAARRTARAAREARAEADLDDGDADWRRTGGAAVRRAEAGLPSQEEDALAEAADRQADAADEAAGVPQRTVAPKLSLKLPPKLPPRR